MKGKYIIEVMTTKIKYKLEIKRNITIIRGNSGTGKTKLISMIRDYNADKASSGVTINCDRECIVVDGYNWENRIQEKKDSIIFIDEGNSFIKSGEFANTVKESSNYFVIITREKLSSLPYSINEIYGLRESKRYGSISQIYNEAYNLYSSFIPKDSIKPSMIITEDSNSGNDFFSKTCNSNIKCISAKGKSKVYKSIVDNPNERGLLFIVDGAAFGCEMEAVIQCMKEYKNGKVYLYTPESFEWLILKSGIISVSQNKLEDTYNYIESKDYFSWENYFCSLLKETTADTKYKYAKKKLNPIYVKEENARKILNIMKKIDIK